MKFIIKYPLSFVAVLLSNSLFCSSVSLAQRIEATASQTRTSVSLDVNDVSVLLPLPSTENWDLLPQATTTAAAGILLPQEYIERLPALLQGVKNSKLYPDLRVLGIRIDPCFMEGLTPTRCQPQIRMVWQPLLIINGRTNTLDVTLHSFYRLSDDEFPELVAALKKIKGEHTDSTSVKKSLITMGVNPLLAAQGLDGDYAKKFFQTIFQYAGQERLARVTFMSLFGRETVWFFGGLDIRNGEATAIRIPRLDPARNTIQQFANVVAPNPTWFRGGMFPVPQGEENLTLLIEDSRKLSPDHEEDIIKATRAAFRFENPKLHNPGTVDCVSCHVAQPAKVWAIRQYPWLSLEQASSDDSYYTPEINLKNMSPLQDRTNIARMFGYFTDQPFVAQRTINETAEVVKFINQNF